MWASSRLTFLTTQILINAETGHVGTSRDGRATGSKSRILLVLVPHFRGPNLVALVEPLKKASIVPLLARLPFLEKWRLVVKCEGVQIEGERCPNEDSSNREAKDRSDPQESQNCPSNQQCDDCSILAIREHHANTPLTVRAVRRP